MCLNLMAVLAETLPHTGVRGLPRDNGLARAETIFLCPPYCRRRRPWYFLVADDPSDDPRERAAGLHARPGQRPHNVQCRWMFLLPRHARPARPHQARRRPRHPLAVRDVLRAEYLP